VTLYRGPVLDTPSDPFLVGPDALAAESDGAIVVRDGVILARSSYDGLAGEHRDEDLVDLRDGILLPGLVDTHVHYPQVRVIAGLGMPLLEWLERCALPEEAKLAEDAYAEVVADEFLAGLARAGTTTALVFGAHFASAMEIFFAAAARSGLRISAGQVVSDRLLRPDLLTTPDVALAEGRKLIERWHGEGRVRYAVTPRFSLSASEPLLDVCAELLEVATGVWFTSHLNENTAEVANVVELFSRAGHYLGSYAQHGLVTPRSVFAHNVHARDSELELLASTAAWVAHCPTSNAALGSGLFPFRRHVQHGVRVSLGSDVGAGTGFSLFKEGLQAYFMQQLLGAEGLPLTPTHLLHLCTRAGAQALGLDHRIGDLQAGKEFDALWLRPAEGSTLAMGLQHAADAYDALAKIFALATPADVARVWVGGDEIV
jgi:guanine deaminase